jgi:hypothetical protein
MRITSDLWHQLDEAARASGRSLSQEVEILLEHALVFQKTMGTKAWRIGVTITQNFLNAIKDAAEENPLFIWDTLRVEPLNDAQFLREGLIRSIALLAELAPDNDIDGLFAAARERIEHRQGQPSAPKSTVRKAG